MDCIKKSNNWNEFDASIASFNTTDQGRAFEELTRLYLLNDPTFKTKIKNLWHHSDLPQKVADLLGLQKPEVGVDLIAEVRDGSYWAIQCKYHSDRERNVSDRELATFFQVTNRQETLSKLSHRLVCTSANGVSKRVEKIQTGKLGYLTSEVFTKLDKEDFDAFRETLKGSYAAPTPFSPRPHQNTALEKTSTFFSDTNNTRGKIIHPCGSGKSLTGYWVADCLNAKTVLVAVPSLALVRQTLGSWTREAVANGLSMDWMAVCSDDDVKNSDDPAMQRVDLGIEVDTDPDAIAAFLSKQTEDRKVLFTTYQSGTAVSAGVKKAGMIFDLGIYDEAHKTVGQKDKGFAHLLFDENVEVKKRVFMTATEREFRGNSDEYLSMDDESIYGTIIDQLSFKAALEQQPPILSDYKIVSTIVTKTEIEQLIHNNDFVKSDGKNWSVEGDASTLASLIALRKLIRNYNLNHVVSFHSSIKRSQEFKYLNTEITKADPSLGKLSVFHVSGKDSTGVRAAELERFVDAETSLITNARCLTEGVDVPAIDAVLFADPKRSKIDIVQAAGRSLRRFDGKDFGYIIVPVVLDEGAENPSDDAFNQIVTVISAMGMSDDRIIEEFTSISKVKGDGQDRIILFDVPEIMRVKLEDFISNIELQIWNRLSFGWVKGVESLKDFVSREGNAKVPVSHIEGGFRLGGWADSRRQDFKNNRLSSERISELEAFPGWTWDPYETLYIEGLKYLQQFVEREGHANMRQAHIEDGFKLGRWVSTRREEFKKNKLSLRKITELEAFPGWVWNGREAQFQQALSYLKMFVNREGHAAVPPNHTEGEFRLGGWVRECRTSYKRNTLSPEKISELEAISGWVWDPLGSRFEEGLNYLKSFANRVGHSRVPTAHVENGFKLGGWARSQRYKFNDNKLTPDKIRALELVPGWTWDWAESDYQEGLYHLSKFVAREGHAEVPMQYEENGYKLGNWVGARRRTYKEQKLSDAKIAELESLPGWTWDPIEDRYHNALHYLRIFADREGHPNVPRSHVENGFKLGNWVGSRRMEYRNNRLSELKVAELEAFPGWAWTMK